MPLDGHSFLVAQGWSGKGTGLREGAISRPLAIPQKKNLAGLGKDRDEAFPFWDHLFSAAAKSIQVKVLSDDEDDNSSDEGKTLPVTEFKRTTTGILSNRRPVLGAPASSGTSTPDVDQTPRYNLLVYAKREAAKRGLYSRFFRGPVLGPDVDFALEESGKSDSNDAGSSNSVVEMSIVETERMTTVEIVQAAVKLKEKGKKDKKEKKAEKGKKRKTEDVDEDEDEKRERKRRKKQAKQKEKSESKTIDAESSTAAAKEERRRLKREMKEAKKKSKTTVDASDECTTDQKESKAERKRRKEEKKKAKTVDIAMEEVLSTETNEDGNLAADSKSTSSKTSRNEKRKTLDDSQPREDASETKRKKKRKREDTL